MVALVDVDQELDGLENPVGFVTLDVESSTEGGADGEEEAIVSFPELIELNVHAELRVEMDVDAEAHDRVEFGVEEIAIEAVLGDAELHHSAQLGSGLVDSDAVAKATEVMGSRHTGGSAPDDADALFAFRALVLGDGPPRVAACFDAVLLSDEAFEGANGDRCVDLASPACVFTRRSTHTAADRGEGIGQPRRQVGELVVSVGDRCYVGTRVGVNRACREAGDVLVIEAKGLH